MNLTVQPGEPFCIFITVGSILLAKPAIVKESYLA
jgi:hypothetical protein